MSRVLVIGCGGGANVAIRKCCQADDVFTELCIASRTKSKCDALAEALKGKTKTVVTTAQVDADKVDELVEKLVEQISTKGGTTEAGIRVLEHSGLEKILDECFDEAIARVRK